jgi:hypothetical protein
VKAEPSGGVPLASAPVRRQKIVCCAGRLCNEVPIRARVFADRRVADHVHPVHEPHRRLAAVVLPKNAGLDAVVELAGPHDSPFRLRKCLAADRASFIEPCLPSPADKPPSGSNWIHEIKHDGFRRTRPRLVKEKRGVAASAGLAASAEEKMRGGSERGAVAARPSPSLAWPSSYSWLR